MHCRDIKILKQNGENAVKNIYNWFVRNKLSLSIGKSNFVLFRGKNKDSQADFTKIKIGDEYIPRMNYVKYIGLNLDELLNWKIHITEICKSLVKYFTVFYNIRKYISKKLMRTIYYTSIYSVIKYGIEIYGSAGITELKRIQTLQNKLLKVLLNKDYQYSTNLLHSELNILKVTILVYPSIKNEFSHFAKSVRNKFTC